MSFVVRSSPGMQPPRAVVLLFGWHGANLKHVLKYSELYKNCATITGVCHPLAIMTKWHPAIDQFVTKGATEACKILRDHGDSEIPIIVHCFSNGGGFCLERLRILSDRGEFMKKKLEDFKIAAEIFDSAPAFMSFKTGVKAMYHGAPNLIAFGLIFTASCISMLAEFVSSVVMRRDNSAVAYWKNMKECTNMCPQAFVFSAIDELTDCDKLDELIRHRKEKLKVDITVLKFGDTAHVQHLRSHPKEYSKLIETMLAKVK